MQKRSILFLASRFPFPLIGGDRIKSYYLLKHLAKTHNVTLVAFNHGGAPTAEQREAIESLGVRLYGIPLYPMSAGVRTVLRMPFMKPFEIDFFTPPEFKKTVDTLLAKEQFDIGISFFMRSAEYIRTSAIPHKILIAEDCRVLYQSRSADNTSNPLQKLVRSWEVLTLKKYEPTVANDFSVTTCVTHTDIKAMQERNSQADYRLLTNGVNVERYVYRDEHKHRKDIIFFRSQKGYLGLLGHRVG